MFVVSDDHHLLAYSTDTSGFHEYTLHVKDLRTDKLLPDRIAKVDTAEWASDNRTMFCITEDEAKRPYQLHRHTLGGSVDELVYEEKDPLYTLSIRRSRDRKYVWVDSDSATTSECRMIAADNPAEVPRLLFPREEGHRYEVEHRNGSLYIRSDKEAKNYRLVTVVVDDPAPKNWKELVKHRDDVLLERAHLFADHCVLSEVQAGLPFLRIMDLRTGDFHPSTCPKPSTTFSPRQSGVQHRYAAV